MAVENYARKTKQTQKSERLTPDELANLFTPNPFPRGAEPPKAQPAMGYNYDTGTIDYVTGFKNDKPIWVPIINRDGSPTNAYTEALDKHRRVYGKEAGKVIFDAGIEHEKTHKENWEKGRLQSNSLEDYSKDEVEAYQAGIEKKLQGLQELGCQ